MQNRLEDEGQDMFGANSHENFRLWKFLFSGKMLSIGMALALTACGLPKSMEVRSGTEPRHEDDDVRFRTTYFYRVFDYCEGDKANPRNIQNDSLYRFKMTGKANALFNKIFFESGTLKSYEIDPLGASIKFDKRNGNFHYQSREQAQRSANCSAIEDQVDATLKRIEFLESSKKDAEDTSTYDTSIALLKKRLETLMVDKSCIPEASVALSEVPVADNTLLLNAAGYEMAKAEAPLPLVIEYKVKSKAEVKPKVPKTPPSVVQEELDENGQAVISTDNAAKPAESLPKQESAAAEAKEQDTATLTKTITVTISGSLKSLAAAGDLLTKITSGSESMKAFSEAGEKLTAIQLSFGDNAINGDVSSKLKESLEKELKEVNVHIQAVSTAFGEIAAQPHLSYLFLNLASDKMRIASEKLSNILSQLGDQKQTLNSVENVNDYKIKSGGKELTKLSDHLKAASEKLANASKASGANSYTCAGGQNLKRGFQVIGPQGTTLYDPDDRLVMAMSSSAEPLIKQLKDISNRVLAEQQSPGDSLLEILKTKKRVEEAIENLKVMKPETVTDDEAANNDLIDNLGESATKGVKQ